MNVYFGLVDYETDGEVFEFDGLEYDFLLSVNEEGIVIKDSCGRYVPISYSGTLDLMRALKLVKKQVKALDRVENTNFKLATCV